MSQSNRTSFMTAAEPESKRHSFDSTIEQDIQYPHYNNHQHNFHTLNPINHDGELPRAKSILRKKHDVNSHYDNNPTNNDVYEHKSLRSSFSSEDLESSHTVINESPQKSYTFKEKNNAIPNAVNHPSQVAVTNSESPLPELKTYPIAWVLLLFIVFLRASTAIFGNTFSPIPSVTAEFMGISLSSINWIYNVMSICYIIASFFTSLLYQTIGVKWSVSTMCGTMQKSNQKLNAAQIY